MSATDAKAISQKELPAELIEFGRREHVSIVEMVGLLGATVSSLGNKLEQAAGLDDRTKSPDIPLTQQLLSVIVTFGERHRVSPLKMVAVLGATLIDIAVSIESGPPDGNALQQRGRK